MKKGWVAAPAAAESGGGRMRREGGRSKSMRRAAGEPRGPCPATCHGDGDGARGR